ncbi:MAG: hypothetical protein KJ726_07990 [Verrucomicrobia bacterium]|nr:hypothetical protein [Verrucomicrobiota bacterium]
MNKIIAIAILAVRGAIRSRVVLVLLGLLLLAVVAVPLTVKSDGTPAGDVQILVRYTLGLAMLILSLSVLWAGCASVSLEWQSQRLQLVVTKPIHPLQLWLGKWLGLVALHVVLLAICGAVTAGLLKWRMREPLRDPVDREWLLDEILVARRSLIPEPVNVDTAARLRFEEEQSRGRLPADIPPETVVQAIRQNLLIQAFSISPGGTREWHFPRPGRLDRERSLLLRFRFSSSTPGPDRVTGAWVIRRGNNIPAVQVQTNMVATARHSIRIPCAALSGEGPLVVAYENIHTDPVTVLFSPEDGLEVLAYAGSFGPNYARALLVLSGQLIFLAALGITAGSLFSMPVAAFVSGFVLLLVQMAGQLQSMAAQPVFLAGHRGEAALSPLGAQAYRLFFKLLHAVMGPLQVSGSLEKLTTGVLVSWSETFRVLLTHGLIYPLLLALLAAWIMRRREVALAG